MGEIKKIALIGANKKSLGLLPFLLKDTTRSRLCIIADSNEEAMLFKLYEMGYRISSKFDIKISRNPEEIKNLPGLDIIINTVQDTETENLLKQPEFKDVEKLGPLSARLIWGSRTSAETALESQGGVNGQGALLASLREIVDAVRLTIDRNELLSVILKLATESTRADRGSIMLLSKEEQALKVEIAKGMDEEIKRKIKVRIGDGISGRVARDGKPLLISGKASSGVFDQLRDRTDVKSALCVPLIVNGETIGVMNVNTCESTLAFSPDDLEFLTNLSELAAEVIHRSNEYEKMRIDSVKLKLWKEADSIMSSFIPLTRRLNKICKKLADAVPGLTCFVYIYDEERKRLALKAGSVKEFKSMGPLCLATGEGIEGTAIENTQDVILVDRTEEEGQKRAYLSLPMVVEGQFVGTLNAQIVSPHGFSSYNESFLKEIRTFIAEKIYKQKWMERETLRSRRMFAVDETGIEIVTMRNPKKIMHIIATAPAAILGAEGSTLRLRRDEKSPYLIMATYGLEDKAVRDYFLPVEKEVVQEVLRKKDVVRREFSAEANPYVRAILSHPLRLDDKIVGALTLFNKINEGSLPPCRFSKNDSEILARFAVYAEKSLVNIYGIGRAGAMPEGGKQPPAPYLLFKQRIEEELNRAGRSGRNMIISTVRVAGLKSATIKDRKDFEEAFIAFLKNRIRNFDMLVWLDPETIGMLFLETDERVTRILGAIPEAMSTDESLYQSFMKDRFDIYYGSSSFPADGNTFDSLYSRACKRVKVNFRRADED